MTSFEYIVINSNNIQIGNGEVSCISQELKGSITIPNTIESKTVTVLGKYAFDGCNISSIILPDTITAINDYCFRNCRIENFSAPTSLVKLGNYAFSTAFIRSADFSMTKIEKFGGVVQFADSLLTNITFPETLTEIPGWFCKRCAFLENLKITKNIISIGASSFIDCYRLKYITSESPFFIVFEGVVYNQDFSVMHIYPSNCSTELLPTVRSISSIKAFSGADLEIFTLKIKIKNVGPSLFRRCPNIKRIDLRCGNFKSLPSGSFASCPLLTELYLPDSIENINSRSITDCPLLNTLYLPMSLKIVDQEGVVYSNITEVYYCGITDVEGILLASVKFHVTPQYALRKFMGRTPVDTNYQCESSICEFVYPDVYKCQSVAQCGYLTSQISKSFIYVFILM